MLKKIGVLLTAAIIVLSAGCSKNTQPDLKKITKEDLTTKEDKSSYVFGVDLAKRLESSNGEFKYDPFIQGFTDQYNKKPPLMTDEEMNVIRTEGRKQTIAANSPATTNKLSPEGNAIASERFMMENKKKEGVVSTESGLQYIIIKNEKGPKPSENDKVKINYIGTSRLGEEFENTYKSGQPAIYPLANIVKGFKEGLMMMSVGSRYKLFIPANLGYGQKGYESIMPNSVLIIEVELLEIIK